MAIDAYTAYWRFGLGPRPGDIGRASDPQALLLAEIADPDAGRLEGDKLLGSVAALKAFREYRQALKAERTAEAGKGDADADMAMDAAPPGKKGKKKGKKQKPAADAGEEALRNYTLKVELPARLRRIGEAEIGLVERLVAFWTNHFAIEADNGGILRALAGPFEREAIRPYVLGSFEELLFAVTRHPAMLVYLDNAASVGPNSKAGKRREAGLNENHARELMELHTLGVDGGYTQADVTSLARILTGWSVGRNEKAGEDFGRFMFRAQAHEPGAQQLLGQSFAQKGVEQGEAALRLLAHHAATARHVATKLVRHFVAEDAPAALVDRLAATFTKTKGDLGAVTRALIEDDAAWGAPAAKLRTPQEYVYAAIRALDFKARPGELLEVLATLGQPLMNPPSPAGFSDETMTWLAPDAMTNRLDVAELMAARSGDLDPRALAVDLFGARLSPATAEAIARAESPAQGLALLLMSPQFQRR